MGRLIDSSELIAVERAASDVAHAEQLVARLGNDCFIAAVQVMELVLGALQADTPQRTERREAFLRVVLRRLVLIPFAEAEARETARLLVAMRSAGTPVGEHDLQIAATALVHGHEVMTRNVRDFAKVPGLRVVDPAL